MRIWLGSMGLSIGGKTYRLVTEQARRISACNLQFFADNAGRQLTTRGGFVKTAISMSKYPERRSAKPVADGVDIG